MLTFAALLQHRLAKIDIKGAYLQAGALPRDIFVIPPKLWRTTPDAVWRLLGPAYGITETGRLWQRCVESFLQGLGFTTLAGILQLFVLRNRGKVVMLLVKVVDDFLFSDSPEHLSWFKEQLAARFTIGSYVPTPLLFNGLAIERHEHGITASMAKYQRLLIPLPLSPTRRKEAASRATPAEVSQARSIAGTLLYYGLGCSPVATLLDSYIAQSLPSLGVADMASIRRELHVLLKAPATLAFPSVPPVYHRVIAASGGITLPLHCFATVKSRLYTKWARGYRYIHDYCSMLYVG